MATAALPLPKPRNRIWPLVAMLVALAGAAALWLAYRGGGTESAAAQALDRQGTQFVKLGLMLGRLAPSEVDSYFGPENLQPAEADPLPTFAELQSQVEALAKELETAGGSVTDHRHLRLQERTRRLLALVGAMKGGSSLSFDEEAKSLYGLDPIALDESKFAVARKELDRLLPGSGSLTSRVEAFRQEFLVPEDLRPKLFARALEECRQRTMKHWRLPPSERLDVEWTKSVDAAWHRYHGNFRSTLQVNPQAVAFLGSTVDVACHEGYPGHHAQFVMAEAQAGAGGLPIEDRMVLLRSPGSVVREGAADYAVSLALPPAERLAFERDVLFPMAGFAPEKAERFERVRQLLDQLAPAALPILRDYRDRKLGGEAAAAALDSRALIASPQALLGFVDALGAYAVGYTGVREQVRSTVETVAAKDEAERWRRLLCLLLLADSAPLGRVAMAIDQGAAKGGISPLAFAPLCGE